jgi:hypothetical protein
LNSKEVALLMNFLGFLPSPLIFNLPPFLVMVAVEVIEELKRKQMNMGENFKFQIWKCNNIYNLYNNYNNV